jgi:hypothetical protein
MHHGLLLSTSLSISFYDDSHLNWLVYVYNSCGYFSHTASQCTNGGSVGVELCQLEERERVSQIEIEDKRERESKREANEIGVVQIDKQGLGLYSGT